MEGKLIFSARRRRLQRNFTIQTENMQCLEKNYAMQHFVQTVTRTNQTLLCHRFMFHSRLVGTMLRQCTKTKKKHFLKANELKFEYK